MPLLQYVQPIVYKSDLKVTPNVSGALQPTLVAEGLKADVDAVRRRAGARGGNRRRSVARTVHAARRRRQPRGHGACHAVRRRGRRLRPAARRARRSRSR